MPTYTYQCADCGHSYDAFQSMKADPDTVCPECSGRVDRLIGAGAGIVFKGSGFYVTDYRNGGKGGENAGETAAAGGESTKKTESAAPAASTATSSATKNTAAQSPAKTTESKESSKSSDS